MPHLEQIGSVTTSSGGLIVVDTGYLGIWSHDQPPAMPEGALSTDEDTKRANSFVDLRITGSDAERAGQLLEMSWDPFFVYDQAPEHSEIEEKLKKLVHKHNLDARFEVISPRIPHRERVNLALKHGAGAGEVQFHGIWAAAVGGVPIGQSLLVVGERMPAPDHYCWKRVLVKCNPQYSISRSEKVGDVAVDYARLLIADFDALGAWCHEDSLDGLADYVFWGRDAEKVAQALNAPLLAPNEFGWTNLSQALAQERGIATEEYTQNHNLKLATDYRPHSHHWQVMEATRNSVTESGTTIVGGEMVCNFMTTWGDGIFEVYRDLAKFDELVQIRIELGIA
jgi:hypothetical protein